MKDEQRIKVGDLVVHNALNYPRYGVVVEIDSDGVWALYKNTVNEALNAKKVFPGDWGLTYVDINKCDKIKQETFKIRGEIYG